MATPAEVQALTESYRVAQARRSALMSALVIQWWRSRVDQKDSGSIERWLAFMVPRIIAAHGQSATLSSVFYTQLRKLEAANAPAFTPIRAPALEPERVRASLIATGPGKAAALLKSYDKMTAADVRRQLEEVSTTELSPSARVDQRIIEKKVHAQVETAISGAVQRHVANGGRGTMQRSAEADKTALGWVRATDADPCYFCAMLASRGLEYGTYSKDSFAASDGRFVGPGDAKVHDHCGCSVKPVYTHDDPYLQRAREFEDQWYEFSTGSSAEAVLTFRRGYEGRIKAA